MTCPDCFGTGRVCVEIGVTERRHLKDLREFFTRNRIPLDVLEKLLRDKRQKKYLITYNRIARIINQHEDLTKTN